jgi:putative ABC transport system ATP-binding protein
MDSHTATDSIVLSNVSKTFRLGRSKIHAVRDVSLRIKKGELLAIVGPSGSGKTTLAHIIGGLAKPDSGEVRANGQQLRSRSDRALSAYRNQHAGFVFQAFGLLPHYTALENVTMPLIVAGVSRRERKKRGLKYLAMLGLEAQAKQRADTLSGGQRQRVSIARALVQHPEIIIADEPTGSLDSAHGQQIIAILEHLSGKQHITVVFVTHDEALAQHADRIVQMRDGALHERTEHMRPAGAGPEHPHAY